MRMVPLTLPLAIFVLGGCQMYPADPLQHAQLAADRGDFMRALHVLDAVHPSYPSYSEARTLAQALERRIRKSHQKVVEGLDLRHEWRDQEAIEKFQQALSIWSGVAGAEGLVAATRRRMQALGLEPERTTQPGRTPDTREVPSVTTRTVPSPADEESSVRPLVITPPSQRSGDSPRTHEPVLSGGLQDRDPRQPSLSPGSVARQAPRTPNPPAGPGPSGPGPALEPITAKVRADQARVAEGEPSKPAANSIETSKPMVTRGEARKSVATKGSALKVAAVGNRLESIERDLTTGRMDRALDQLDELWKRFPSNTQVTKMFARVLHQRALLAYGQGRLVAAIEDWGRVTRLEPDRTSRAAFLQAAKTELAARKKNRPIRK